MGGRGLAPEPVRDWLVPSRGEGWLNEIGIGCGGRMMPTAYDTAWLGQVPAEHDLGGPAFPGALDWLRKNQRMDGSWGAGIEYVHDRVISTLVSILALARWSWENESPSTSGDVRAIERGLQYIRRNAARLDGEGETIGFELILPTLLKKCQQLGLDLPHAAFERYERMRADKMARIPPHMLYSRNTTLAFSLEFMGDDLDLGSVRAIQERDGSVAVSPSATAYLLTRWPENEAARRYIAGVSREYGGKAPQVFPFDVFETAWSLWNLLLSGVAYDGQVTRHLAELKALWDRKEGVGYSSNHSVPNADDSAIVFRVLQLTGLDPDPGPLDLFERDDYFICYPFERNPSIGTNIHVLEALKGMGGDRASKVVRWLRSVQVDGHYWMDKWHASPYYATAHAVIALVEADQELAGSGVRWILETQRPDGGWGYYDRSTAEETAYCLQALCVYSRYVEPVDRAVLVRGRRALLARRDELPALWIGKCLYVPVRVVQSVIHSALAMTRTVDTYLVEENVL